MAESRPIQTTRLLICPFGAEYLTDEYVGWLNDSVVVRYSEQRFHHHTLESCREYWHSFRGTDNYFWAIIERHPLMRHIGTMTAHVQSHHRVADIGILVGDRGSWGRGYGLESWNAVCRYLFDGPSNIRKITAGTLACNKAMISIMSRSGMVPDGRRVRQCLVEDTEVDIVYAALFRNVQESLK